jgi:hypothetical protein
LVDTHIIPENIKKNEMEHSHHDFMFVYNIDSSYVIIDENDKIFVIDINPRLTSSYAGLREATGRNPAQIILACILQPHFKFPTLQKNIVEIEI